MNISNITSILPNGEPYQSQYGLLYPFIVSFQDNTQGTVNTKTAQPPYKVGDRVGYEVTGDFRGVSKLKISKNPDKAFGGTPPPQVQPPYQSRPSGALPAAQPNQSPEERVNVEAIQPVMGASVGHSLTHALALLTSGLTHDEIVERITSPVFWYSVHEVASDVIRVARELERGRLAPSPTQRAKGIEKLKSRPDSHPDLEPVDSNVPF